MALLNKEQLQERFKLSRERKEKKKEAERKKKEAERKKKEAERKKRKAESDKLRKETMAELNKPRKINLVKLDTPSTEKEWKHYVVDNCSSIISRILVGDIYETREELMEAEKRGEGKLNWEFFNKLVKEVRKELN